MTHFDKITTLFEIEISLEVKP